MRINGGLGGITVKNVPLQASASERLVAVVHGNGQEYWILTHSLAGNTFYAWLVNGSGASTTPVTSVSGIDQGPPNSGGPWTYGYLKASPNGLKLASTCLRLNTTELFDFDPMTGRVSNGLLLYKGLELGTAGSGPYYCYGITFSPDSKLLYQAVDRELIQYDITLPTGGEIIASGTKIASLPGLALGVAGAMQIGPSGKIYTMDNATFNTWVGIIENPNVLGQGCNYNSGWMPFTWNALESVGLPNNIDAQFSYVPGQPNSIVVPGSNPHCRGDSIVLTAPSGFSKYEWSTGARTRRINVDSSGIYSVIMTDALGCIVRVATEIVVVDPPTPKIIPLTPIVVCEGEVIRLQVDSLYSAYLWSDGSKGREVEIKTSGIWRVTVTDTTGCTGTDSLEVRVIPAPRPLITGDGKICFGDSTTLDPGPGFLRYLWSTGDTTRTIQVTGSGNYTVTVWDTTGCSGVSPTAVVIMKDSIIPSIAPSGIIELCEGDSIVITTDAGYARYVWSNGESGSSIVTGDSGVYQVTAYDADGCFGASGTVQVIVHKPPPVPTISLLGDSLEASIAPNYTWRYNNVGVANGSGRRIATMGPGIYTVTTVDTNGCFSPSAPYRILASHVVWLDTISARVGERVWLTMHAEPPIEAREMLTRYRFDLSIDPTSLFVHRLLDPPGTATSATRPTLSVSRDGSIQIDRVGVDPITGDQLFRIELEGLSTGVPINVVPILSMLFPESDTIRIAGNGLVILAGCDISNGFRVGKKVRIDKIVPNPTSSGEIVVTYHAPEGAHPILVVVDALGGELVRQSLATGTSKEQEVRVDPKGFSSGVYWVRIWDKGEETTVPVVVVR
jgi:hypothetical protein